MKRCNFYKSHFQIANTGFRGSQLNKQTGTKPFRISIFLALILIFNFLFISCGPTKPESNEIDPLDSLIPASAKEIPVHYAKGFKIFQDGDLYYLIILNPWQQARNINLYYIIGEKDGLKENMNPVFREIQLPIQTLACMSTTHLGFLHALQSDHLLIAFSGTNYVYTESIRHSIESGQIQEIGYEQSLNFERLVTLKPDLLINYGVSSEASALGEILQKLGIRSLISAEYLETHPLGKAEWIKVFGLISGKAEEAGKRFREIEKEYMELVELTGNLQFKPLVMTGLPWKDVWYLTGTESYLPNFIADAGGRYFNSKYSTREPLSMNIEAVYEIGHQADIWINAGSAFSLEQIRGADARLTDFKAFQESRIFNNNARISEKGGMDYFETGTIEPQIILYELIQIFHPGILPEKEFKYYQQLK